MLFILAALMVENVTLLKGSQLNVMVISNIIDTNFIIKISKSFVDVSSLILKH